MGLREYMPFNQAPPPRPARRAEIVKPVQQKALAKIMKATTLALGASPAFGLRSAFEVAPYDFNRIIQAIDTDSYVKQAFLKYKELMWKGGWDIVGENQEAVDYLYQRIDFLEIAMKQPFNQFLEMIGDQAVKFHNVFIVKARGDLASYFPSPIRPVGDNTAPIVGYEFIPVETVRITRDAHNRPLRYRQELNGFGTYGNGPNDPEWDANKIIHLYIDKKPGHLFGTPFMTAVTDDVVSLRQMEEDVLNMVHQELFPFYSVTVGTPEEPGEEDEILQAVEEINAMRTEGAMVHSERRHIEVLGADGHALQADPYLAHWKERVCVGLGLAPHHLGMMMNGGNRSVTDRLDIALYDKIKTYQRYLANAARINIFNELLLEGGFNPYVRPEERCEFRFREIDLDSLIKEQTHTVNLWNNDLLEQPEARMRLRLDPHMNEAETHAALAVRMTPDTLVPGKPATPGAAPSPPTTVDTTPKPALKPDAQKPSTGGRPNQPNNRRATGNAVRPANQHGRRTSPNVRHSDTLDDIIDLLKEDEDD